LQWIDQSSFGSAPMRGSLVAVGRATGVPSMIDIGGRGARAIAMNPAAWTSADVAIAMATADRRDERREGEGREPGPNR
jgi:hypothetical protein